MKTGGEIFWENVRDCLEYYDYNKSELARIMCFSTDLGVHRKNSASIDNSLRRFSKENTMPDNIWLLGIRDALRIIDTDNKDYPVEFSDLLKEGFFKE